MFSHQPIPAVINCGRIVIIMHLSYVDPALMTDQTCAFAHVLDISLRLHPTHNITSSS